MASERRPRLQIPQTAYRGSGERLSDLKGFVRRTPQFRTLAEVAEEHEPEPYGSRQEFLDDFASQLAERVAEDDVSGTGN